MYLCTLTVRYSIPHVINILPFHGNEKLGEQGCQISPVNQAITVPVHGMEGSTQVLVTVLDLGIEQFHPVFTRHTLNWCSWYDLWRLE